LPDLRFLVAHGQMPERELERHMLSFLAGDADVVVAISRAYRTTCTLVRSGNEAFVVDSPVFPDELEMLPGVLGHEESAVEESFSEALEGGVEYPHYTRPFSYRGLEVPDVLLSGHHARIAAWLAFAQAQELAAYGCTAVALTPGWILASPPVEPPGLMKPVFSTVARTVPLPRIVPGVNRFGKALMPAPAKGHGAAMPRPNTNGSARAAGVPVA
jgi:hypothetical protein